MRRTRGRIPPPGIGFCSGAKPTSHRPRNRGRANEGEKGEARLSRRPGRRPRTGPLFLAQNGRLAPAKHRRRKSNPRARPCQPSEAGGGRRREEAKEEDEEAEEDESFFSPCCETASSAVRNIADRTAGLAWPRRSRRTNETSRYLHPRSGRGSNEPEGTNGTRARTRPLARAARCGNQG